MYTDEELRRYTRLLAKYGVTDETEVKAVLDYIHFAVCIAIKEVQLMNNKRLPEGGKVA